MKLRQKKQLNTRIPLKIYDAEKKVRDGLGWTADEIAEVAYASLFGSRDALIAAKRERIIKKFKELSLELSFDPVLHQSAGLQAIAA